MKTIENEEEFIEYSKKLQDENIYRSAQVDLYGKDKELGFTEYLISLADIHRVDILDGNKSIRRQRTDMDAKDVLPIMSDSNVLKSGIKIFHKTPFKYDEWSDWDGGCIEGFTCFSRDPKYFIWTYIRMEHLEDMLNKFKDSLIDYRY